MFIIAGEYFYKNIIQYNIEEIQEAIAYKEIFYKPFCIPKKNGMRKILGINPSSDLFIMQRNLLDHFLSKIQLPVCVKGFVKQGSYSNYLIEHRNQKFYMRMDIKDFFDSITSEQIEENLSEYVKVPGLLPYIIELCTLENKLPQGAITSPAISNIVFRRIDQRITKYCQKFEVTYTRYADDLLFSSNKLDFKNQKWFYKKIKYILKENGFESNFNKKHIEKGRLCLGGYVIEKDIHLSRKKLNTLNQILYYFKDLSNSSKYTIDRKVLEKNYIEELNQLKIKETKTANKTFNSKVELVNYLCGYRSFLISIIKANGNKRSNLSNKIKQIETLVNALE